MSKGATMDLEQYGPIAYLAGQWTSEYAGENRAPAPDRSVENSKFRQEISFTPIGEVNNHEQSLFGLRYNTVAWVEGTPEPFHEELGYWLWDPGRQEVMKTFVVPRGIAVNAGGVVTPNATEFTIKAELGSKCFGLSANPFLQEEFKILSYETTFTRLDEDNFHYAENTRIQMKAQSKVFDHTESNTLTRKAKP